MRTTFAYTSVVNPDELAQNTEYQARTEPFFAKFLSENVKAYTGREVPPVGRTSEPRPPDGIIQSWRDLEHGGTQIRIPIATRLLRNPIGGTKEQVQGMGEVNNLLYRTLSIHPWVKPVSLVTGEDAQILRDNPLQVLNNAQGRLSDFYAEWFDASAMWTINTGYDPFLTTLKGLTGARAAFTPFSQANFMVAGQGRVNYGSTNRPGSAGFETAAIGKLTSMAAANAGMTPDRFRAAVRWANRFGVSADNYGGKKLLCAVMKGSAYHQLSTHADFQNDMRHAFPRGTDNPLFSGAEAIFGGAIIYTVEGLHGIQTNADGSPKVDTNSSLGMPAYGPAGSFISESGSALDLDSNNIALTYFMGKGAMHRAWGRQKMKYTTQEWNHGLNEEMALHVYSNLIRGDSFDNDNNFGNGANVFYQNTSIATLATYTPYDLVV